MNRLSRRAKNTVGRFVNSIRTSTVRSRRNSLSPFGLRLPKKGDSYAPLLKTSARSNSVETIGAVEYLEPPIEDIMRGCMPFIDEEEPDPPPKLEKCIQITEYIYITDNAEMLGDMASKGVSYVVCLGDKCPPTIPVKNENGTAVSTPLTLFFQTNVNPNLSFNDLTEKFDIMNLFIDDARSIKQKTVIYCEHRRWAFFFAAEYNIDYYKLDTSKAVGHLMKMAKSEWIELPESWMRKLSCWKAVVVFRRATGAMRTNGRLSLSIRSMHSIGRFAYTSEKNLIIQ